MSNKRKEQITLFYSAFSPFPRAFPVLYDSFATRFDHLAFTIFTPNPILPFISSYRLSHGSILLKTFLPFLVLLREQGPRLPLIIIRDTSRHGHSQRRLSLNLPNCHSLQSTVAQSTVAQSTVAFSLLSTWAHSDLQYQTISQQKKGYRQYQL